MIDLFSFAEKQRKLDSNLEIVPHNDQVVCAINAELGELVNTRKYNGWCWWPRSDKSESSREEILGELIDVLHFLLLGYNKFNDVPKCYHQALLDEHRMIDPLAEEVALADVPSFVSRMAIQQRYHDALVYWCDLAMALGFGSEDIERGFEASVEKNLERWG